LAALNKSRDSGKLIASGRINLVQLKENRAGFLAFVPIYRKGQPLDSVEQRRRNLIGFSLGVFRLSSLISGSFKEKTPTPNKAENLNEAMRDVLGDICSYKKWPVGHVYVRSENDADVLVPTDMWHLDEPERFAAFRDVTEKTTFKPGVGLPGRVAISGKPAWIFDVTKDPNFPRAKLADDIGVKAGFACPVIVGMEVVAVLEFFAPDAVEPDQSLLDTLVQIGLQLGRVAERAMARDTLLDSQQQLSAVFENVVDGIITIDEKGKIQRFNPASEKIFGYGAEEAIGQNVNILMPDPYHGEHDGYLKNYVVTNNAKIIGKGREVEGRRKGGSIFPMDLAVSEMWIAGQRMFTGIVRDITERKQIDKMKNEFISTVSHELRTPLTSIKGSLALVRSGVAEDFPKKPRSMIDIAYSNSDRLVRLINDILDIEKIESGKIDFRMEALDLMPLVERAIEENKGFADRHEVTLAIVDTVSEAMVEGDQDRLLQVLTNLLSNAVKFSPEGESVEVSASRKNGGYRVAVKDHGPGIPEAFRERIFGKFTQADSSDTRKKGGTGLGLSISKAIVEEHGGAIGFDTQTGDGATFFFDLPHWEKPKATPNVNQEAQLSEGQSSENNKPRILHVEDDEDLAIVVSAMVGNLGEITLATSLSEGKRQLAEQDFDLIILDLMLPDGDGEELLIHHKEGSREGTPVIVFSAKEVPRDTAKNIEAVLIKSRTTNEQLVATIRTTIERMGEDARKGQ
jgi:PAS domain S-box-containing protein